MNEQEWLASDNPQPMVRWLGDRLSNRKARLFAAACCRMGWHLHGPFARQAIVAMEAYADDPTRVDMLSRARAEMDNIGVSLPLPRHVQAVRSLCSSSARNSPGAADCMRDALRRKGYSFTAHLQAQVLRDIVGFPFRPVHSLAGCGIYFRVNHTTRCHCGRCKAMRTPEVQRLAEVAYQQVKGPCPCDYSKAPGPECQRCAGTGGVGALDAQALAILADALEEAGSQEQCLLRALRGFVPCMDPTHQKAGGNYWCPRCGGTEGPDEGWARRRWPVYRGFWALDLVLGRE